VPRERQDRISEAMLQSAFQQTVPAGGVGSGAVQGESLLVGELKGCYWWKTV
jgi:hypothetical protein